MLDVLNRYGHGYVAMPVIVSCKKKGLFKVLKAKKGLGLKTLSKELKANEGHLAVALGLLEALGWLSKDKQGKYRLTKKAAAYEQVPEKVVELLSLSVEDYLAGKGKQKRWEHWLEVSQQGWSVSQDELVGFLDGLLVVPLFLGLRQCAGLRYTQEEVVLELGSLGDEVRGSLCKWLVAKGWGQVLEEDVVFTEAGRFLLEGVVGMAAVVGYRSMLLQMDELLFGKIKVNLKEKVIVGDGDGNKGEEDLEEAEQIKEIDKDCCGELLRSFCRKKSIDGAVFVECAGEAGLFFSGSEKGFCKRAYKVRCAQAQDISHLLELEKACWAEPLRASQVELEERLAVYGRGQLVLEYEGQVVAAVYSQRISTEEGLYGTTFRKVLSLYSEDGGYVQLLALNVLPAFQSMALGDELLDFILQRSCLLAGVRKVIAVTLFKDYETKGKASGLSLQQYLDDRDDCGYVSDAIVRFHQLHGAKVQGLVKGYRPQDKANKGYGVLVQYDCKEIVKRNGLGKGPSVSFGQVQYVVSNANELACYGEGNNVHKKVEAVIQKVCGRGLLLDKALMTQGLDSSDLLGLRVGLSQAFGVELQPSVFFSYPSLAAIVQYLENKQEIKKDMKAEKKSKKRKGKKGQAMDVYVPNNTNEKKVEEQTKRIAIIGMACRFPGGVKSPEDFWQLLCEEHDGVELMPQDRRALLEIEADSYGDNQSAVKGLAERWGGFLEGVDLFDAHFFGISPREAEQILYPHNLLQ